MMENNAPKKTSLRDFREKKPVKREWLRKHCPWLFRWDSLFYFAIFLFVLAGAWTIFTVSMNSFTQLLSWDYTWQYISFTYRYWDAWHEFFGTGHFPLYDAGLFMGSDMIGSGAYYGLLDPFMIVCYLFPRSWIPHMYMLMTFAKMVFGALMMRGYLRTMGIREWTARIGGLIYGFSGYVTFFEGFPSFASAVAFLPLILWGIEKTIREQKPTLLILGVAGLSLSCFFFVPVLCIFGVLYALWRFFATIKSRNGVTNVRVMILGVCGFAIGLMLGAVSLLPSVRESLLSGRSSSIGSAYLKSIIDSLKSRDVKSFFSLVFEEVGDSPGRELMGLISFFFPTGGWTTLPLARSGYDAWTASLFCYTPCVILFFAAIINSIRLRKWGHLVVVVVCVYAVFTNFSYFFFYAFTGNGYGRWYLILIPLIVYYCCWAFDLREEEPKFIPFVASLLALGGTIFTFYFTEKVLKDRNFTSAIYNVHHTTYWQTTYHTAHEEYNNVTAVWYFYYQLAFVVVEGFLLCLGHRAKWTKFALLGLVAVEAAVMGNLAYVFNGTWSYQTQYLNGEYNRENSLVMARHINDGDKTFFRTQSDTFRGKDYFHNVVGLNNTAAFHSLMNFDLETFALNNQFKLPGSTSTTYGDEKYYNPRWTGVYGHKRFATDTILGMRYYIVENVYSSWKDAEGKPMFLPSNVPFGAEEIPEYSPDRDRYRVYRRGEDSLPSLGYAVDSNMLYYMKNDADSAYRNQFFHYWAGKNSYLQLAYTQYVESHGAIIDDGVTLPESFNVIEDVPDVLSDQGLYTATGGLYKRLYPGSGLYLDYYETKANDLLFASTKEPYYSEGVAYFLNHHTKKRSNVTSTFTMARDTGKLVARPSSGTYFNDSFDGCYIEFRFYNDKSKGAPRVYAIGDRQNKDGSVEENVCLSFDHFLLQNMAGGDYFCSEDCTFGLYAEGKIKYFVLCYGKGSAVSVTPTNFYMSVMPKATLDAFEGKIVEDGLKNVKMDGNLFTFKTRYDAPRIVTTQLGYDKGWQAVATMPNGEKRNCQMLRLNGGLVGFVAPYAVNEENEALSVSYELRYVTPNGNLAVALWSVGVVLFAGILGTQFAFDYRKKKKATVLDA